MVIRVPKCVDVCRRRIINGSQDPGLSFRLFNTEDSVDRRIGIQVEVIIIHVPISRQGGMSCGAA